MQRHVFGQVTARVEDDGVHLAFSLKRPFYRDPPGVSVQPMIRIHRQCEPRYQWVRDAAGHFDGLQSDKARLIFEGSITPLNGRKFVFVDKRVKAGRTYVYWVSSPLGRLPNGPVAVRVRDRRVWWPYQAVESRLAAIAAAYPTLASMEPYGTTVGGITLTGLRVGNRDRSIALIGTIHAGESGPELLIPAIERLLAENAALLGQVGVALLPSVNVDERERLVRGCPWYLRKNARGVDLNRNFDAGWDVVQRGYGVATDDPDGSTYRGPGPGSEPETQAVVAFLNAVRPEVILSYHAMACLVGTSLLTPAAAKNDDGYYKACMALVGPFVAAFYELQDPVVASEFGKSPPDRRTLPSHAGLHFAATKGSLPFYGYDKLRVPCFDVENDGNPEYVPALSDETTPELLAVYQERHYRGLLALLKTCAGRH